MMTKIIYHTTLCMILSCLLMLSVIGCGGKKTKPTDKGQTTDHKNKTKKQSNISGSSSNIFENSEKGKMLGDIPYDVWFKDPIAIAGNGTPVAIVKTTPQTNQTPSETIPKITPKPKTTSPQPSGGKVDWKKVIPAEVLNDEVKSIRNRFTGKLKTVGTYNRSYLEFKPFCVSMAVLSEIASEHSGSLRWKKNAKLVRNLSAQMISEKLRSGAKSYKQIRIPFEQICDTLDGSPPSGLKKPSDEDSFSDVADMGDVMKRMEMLIKFLKDNAGNENTFKKYQDDLKHRAYILAALTKAMNSEGYGNSDDEVYTKYTNNMVKACVAMAVAAESDDFAAFEKAMPQVNQSCIDCHTAYRN
ncbi:hypothetical protein MNBD_PLANCTO02-112 [hydrothermal vent metagenome]|uniref:Cytochrome C n=1 Tax=hydrothermal vent metagenome TaxID=652676 RepID=A0A3B1DKZ6_9ZZZZ